MVIVDDSGDDDDVVIEDEVVDVEVADGGSLADDEFLDDDLNLSR